MVFTDGFQILVKELGLLTNLSKWIRGFGCRRILYIVLYCKQCTYDEYNIKGADINMLLFFLVWLSRVKSLCNVSVPLYLFCFY
jgi:predicted nucleic-acid-binding Zn-ribbon protein